MVDSDELETAPVRAVRASAVGRGTHGVPELRLLVEGALARAFPVRIWVAGRVTEPRTEHRVGLHFVLQATTEDEPFQVACLITDEVLAAMAEVLDRVHDADVADLVTEDRLARVGGLLRYDVLRSTLVLHVSELDPTPTFRSMEEQREQARERLRGTGLAARQRSRAPRAAPLSVTVIGAHDDPAVARVAGLLSASPYAVEVRSAVVPLHGPEAPAAIAGCVREAALRCDVVLLVRERGRPLALGVFDTPEVAGAVGEALVPVVCALGTDGATTASDDVAAVSLPDGDAAARWVLDRLAEAARSLALLAAEVLEEAALAATRARAALDTAREDTLRTADEAAARATRVRRTQRLRGLVLAGVLAVAFVVAAVLVGQPLLFAGPAVVAVVVLAVWVWSRWAMRRGPSTSSGNRSGMSQQDDDFARVLTGLRQVRDELAATSSPEKVHRLRGSAEQLVAEGERILGRELPVVAPV